ncbi:MAG: Fic family protein [Planctomycetes bacterium]|nr:Fic family protein [Planctomycetota bacterium]
MRVTPCPSDWFALVEGSREPFEVFRDERGRRLIQRANARCWHWAQLRRRELPPNWRAEAAWAAAKLVRVAQAREFGLRSADGTPFSYWWPESALHHLLAIDTLASGEASHEDPLPRAGRRHLRVFIDEALALSGPAGASITREEALEIVRGGRRVRTRAERLLRNTHGALLQVREWRERPLSPELIADLQRVLTAGTLDSTDDEGRIRGTADPVPVLVARDAEDALPAPAPGELVSRLAELCAFANSTQAQQFHHPAVRALLLLFWLLHDRPFAVENERTARALCLWALLRDGYRVFEHVALARVFADWVQRQTWALHCIASDECDVTYFVVFGLRAMRRALREWQTRRSRRGVTDRAACQLRARLPWLKRRQAVLLHELCAAPTREISIGPYRADNGVSYGTAYYDLTQLAQRGLLRRMRRGKRWVFRSTDDLAEKLRHDTGQTDDDPTSP